jgi:hypothetical protein
LKRVLKRLGGAVMLALCFMGSCLFFFKKDPNIFLNGVGLFGLVWGIALTLAIRGWTIAAIIAISKIYVALLCSIIDCRI